MLINNINIEIIRREIDNLLLSEHLRQDGYSNLFYEHLTSLFKFKMLSEKNTVDEIVLNEKSYFGIEQYVLENTEIVEKEKPQNKIDWDLVDDSKDYLKEKLKKVLKYEANSDFLKPIIDYTTDTYENSIIYRNLHPNSFSNPWIPTNTILLDNGYLLLVSDNKDLVTNYSRKILDNVSEKSSSLFIVATSGKDRKFSGFPIDKRSNTQGLVFEFLKREAIGINGAKDITKIIKFLNTQEKRFDAQEVKSKVILPLKRAGLIGSTTNGYFFINSETDLIYSYKHHKEKLLGIQRTIDMYKKRASQIGLDLEKY